MKQLEKKIAQLEKEIQLTNQYINNEYLFLRNQIDIKTYIYLGMAGSFIIGFFLVAHKKKSTQFIRTLTNIGFKANHLYQKVKLFL